MENNKHNDNDELLRQILTEISGENDLIEPEQEIRRTAEAASQASEQPQYVQPVPVQKPVQEEKTAIHKAVRSEEVPSLTDEIQRAKQNEALYEDLDGISQTQIQRRKAANSSNSSSNKKKKKKSKGMRALRSIILTFFILGVSLFLAYLIITYGRDVLGINNNNTTKIVTIPQGADTQQIAELLEDEGIITYPKLFTTFAGLSGKDVNFTAGDHELRADMAYDTIFENLASPSLGSADVVDIAFQEGITLVEAAEKLEEQGVCDADEFIDYFNNEATFDLAYEEYLPSFTTDKFYKMEGYLFPDTYQFYIDMDVDLVCQKILRNFNNKITARDYERMNELGITLDQTITLASIIQCEAGSLDQMSRISSVFWNRMNNSETFPKLQSDPTIGYVEDVIKPHIKAYNEEMFEGYNTYECNGLPAGAICNPGYDAIQAALYPASTDYFYFYANLNTKETYFSRTLAEHEAWINKVEGNQYVATEPLATQPASGIEVGLGTGFDPDSDNEETTTTQVVNGNIW